MSALRLRSGLMVSEVESSEKNIFLFSDFCFLSSEVSRMSTITDALKRAEKDRNKNKVEKVETTSLSGGHDKKRIPNRFVVFGMVVLFCIVSFYIGKQLSKQKEVNESNIAEVGLEDGQMVPVSLPKWTIQTVTYSDTKRAQDMISVLKNKDFEDSYWKKSGGYSVVYVGHYVEKEDAISDLERLRQWDFPDAFIRSVPE